MIGGVDGLVTGCASVLTATGLVNGKWHNFLPPQNPHPSTDHHTVTGNYVGDPNGCAKFGANLPVVSFWANG